VDERRLCTRIKEILVGRLVTSCGKHIRILNMGCGQSHGALVVTPGQTAHKPEQRQAGPPNHHDAGGQQCPGAGAGSGEGSEAPLSAQATPRREGGGGGGVGSSNRSRAAEGGGGGGEGVAPPLSSVTEGLNPNERDSLTHLQGAVATFLSESGLQGLQTTQAQPPDKAAAGKAEGALVVLRKAMEMYELSLSEEVRTRAMVRA